MDDQLESLVAEDGTSVRITTAQLLDQAVHAATAVSAPRDRQVRSSRRDGVQTDVMTAAAESFTERGYAATSIDDIALRLGVTKGFVYHYYRSKADLFIDVHRTALHLLMGAVVPEYESIDSADRRLYRMAYEHARVMVLHRPFMRVSVQSVGMYLVDRSRGNDSAIKDVWQLRKTYESLFADVITDGIKRRVFRKVELTLATKPVLGALNWISIWNSTSDEASAAALASSFAEFVVAGLCR